MNQNLLINNLIRVENKNQAILKNILLVLSGTIFLALMSQLTIPLPFTPVPNRTNICSNVYWTCLW